MILCNEYESFAVHLQLELFLVSARPRVFRSGRSVATLVFTAPPTRSSKVAISFDLLFRDLTEIFQHYSQITPSTRGIAHQHTSHLQRKVNGETPSQQLFLGRLKLWRNLVHVRITPCTVSTHTYILVLLPYTMAQISYCMVALSATWQILALATIQ